MGGPTHDNRRRVLVTGVGAITPSGLSADAMWRAVVNGRSAIARLEGPEFVRLPVRIGGPVRGFDPAAVVPQSLARRTSPVQQWAIAAADEALRQAGVLPPVLRDASDGRCGLHARQARDGDARGLQSDADPGGRNATADVFVGAGRADSFPALPWPRSRFAVVAATGSGPVDAMQAATRALDARGPRGVPFTLAAYGAPDAAAALLAARYGAFGASQAVSATCASGAVGLGTALRWIRHGYADAVLVVGMEDCLGPVNLASNARMHALAVGYEARPAQACRPFDRARSGFVMSAGACATLLESEDAVRARTDAGSRAGAASALAELVGFGASSDAFHATSPRPDGACAALAIRACLDDAGVTPDAVDHINAHGTGTPAGDAAEIAALDHVFGVRGRQVPISATKSSTGHLLGAAGVAEAIIAVQTLRAGLLPPTLNLDDPEFPDWDIVTGTARRLTVDTVLSTSFGFGGHNGVVLLRRWS